MICFRSFYATVTLLNIWICIQWTDAADGGCKGGKCDVNIPSSSLRGSRSKAVANDYRHEYHHGCGLWTLVHVIYHLKHQSCNNHYTNVLAGLEPRVCQQTCLGNFNPHLATHRSIDAPSKLLERTTNMLTPTVTFLCSICDGDQGRIESGSSRMGTWRRTCTNPFHTRMHISARARTCTRIFFYQHVSCIFAQLNELFA